MLFFFYLKLIPSDQFIYATTVKKTTISRKIYCLKSIFYMIDIFLTLMIYKYADHIKTQASKSCWIVMQILQGRFLHALHFFIGYGFSRTAIELGFSGLYLNKDYFSLFLANNIQFTITAIVIPADNFISIFLQVLNSPLLPIPSQFLFICTLAILSSI